jgi:glycosyltransferase involved in cell wall biosynthesis
MKFRKVCFFLPSSNRDGAELSGLECMDALKALGMRCHVVIPKKGPLIADLTARQITYQIIPYKVWIEPPVPVWKGFLVTLWNLVITYVAALLISRRQCDLIITNTINICVGALVAKLHGLPHIWYFREFGYEDHGWRFHLGEKPSRWLMNRLSLLCLSVSRAVAEKYQKGMAAAKVHYVYQPIEVDQSASPDIALEKQPFQITAIMVGRLQEGKRQEDAIRALALLREQGVTAGLWLVGGGDQHYADFLQKLVQEKALTAQVRFLGQVENAFPYIQKADVLILCSRCEAFARVVVEAMKAGKPVLGSRCGGTVEQIMDGVNGFLYEPRDHQELAEKIRYLLDHPHKALEMGRNGREWAMQTFTRERYRKNLARILGEI